MVTVETNTIRGLDIDKMIKGFALTNYIFKGMVNNSTTSGDSVRWYQETAADLTLTSPSFLETSPLSQFEQAEVDWTRNTAYPRSMLLKALFLEKILRVRILMFWHELFYD